VALRVPTNNFQSRDAALPSYTRAVTITPNNSTDLVETTRAIIVDHATLQHAMVSVILSGDTAAVTIPIRTGVITPIRATRIRVTGTDASTVVALY
jgi:hypothetical protein